MGRPIDIYARVSALHAKDKTTTTGQVAVCRRSLADRGLAIGETFIDDGKSAWDPKVYRPGWQAVMGRIESGQSGGVIVYDLERFARKVADGERLVEAAERGLMVLDSEQSYDLRNPGDKKNFRNAIASAEYYSDLLSARAQRGKAAKAAEGKVDSRRSFGFEGDGITLKADEVEIIRDWARRLLAGETQESLIEEANARGIPSVRGATWGYTTFRQIMSRPRNIGLIVHKGEVVAGARLPGEQILPDGTYKRLIALYEARKPGRPPSSRYLLTSLAYCSCGARLSGRTVHKTDRRQYWCRTGYTNHTPGPHSLVDASRLDMWAAEFTVRTLADPDRAEAVAAAEELNRQELNTLSEEASAIEITLGHLSEKLAAGLPAAVKAGRADRVMRRHDAICGPLEARLAEIAASLEALEAEPIPVPKGQRTIPRDAQRYLMVLDEWDSGTPESRRAMVIRALGGARLVVGPGKDAKFDPDRVTAV